MDQIQEIGVEQAQQRPVGAIDVHEYAAALADEFAKREAELVQRVVGLQLQLREQQQINEGMRRAMEAQRRVDARAAGVTQEPGDAPAVFPPGM